MAILEGLALQTAHGFWEEAAGGGFLALDGEWVSDGCVGISGAEKVDDGVGVSLIGGSSFDWFDPPHGTNGSSGERVGAFDGSQGLWIISLCAHWHVFCNDGKGLSFERNVWAEVSCK